METINCEDPSSISLQTPAQTMLIKYAQAALNLSFWAFLFIVFAAGLWNWVGWLGLLGIFISIFVTIQAITNLILIEIGRRSALPRMAAQIKQVLSGLFAASIIFIGVNAWDPYYTMHHLCLYALISTTITMGFIVILMISINRIKPGDSPNANA
jgi:uncharacterized membrane protein